MGVLVDNAEIAHRSGDSTRLRRLTRLAKVRLSELEQSWRAESDSVGDTENSEHLDSGLLSIARNLWRLSLLEDDRDAVLEYRELTLTRTHASSSGDSFDKFRLLDGLTRRSGYVIETEDLGGPLNELADRGELWRLNTS
jgi:hypothetical protein